MPAVDTYNSLTANLSSPLPNAAAVIPSDTEDLEFATRCLWVGVAGNLVVNMLGGQQGVVYENIHVGWHPIRVTRVLSTGTTATNIVANW